MKLLLFLTLFSSLGVTQKISKKVQRQEFNMNLVQELLAMQNGNTFKIGSWDINYPKSFITLNDIIINTPKVDEGKGSGRRVKTQIGKVIGDYLYFDNKKDIAYYALRVEDVGIVLDTTGDEKRDRESGKLKLEKINPPITNVLKEFFITRVEVLLRDLRESDELSLPFVITDVLVKELEILPVKERSVKNYANISLKGKIFDGTIYVDGKVNPFHKPQVLNLNIKVENVSLVELNPYLRRFAKIDAKEGKISVIIESAVKGDSVEGSLEFLTKDAEMVKGWQEGQPFLKNLKENVMDLGFRLLNKGDDDDTVTGRIPFTGKVDEIKWGFWELFETLLTHAVASPLRGDVKESVELNGED